MIKRYHVSHGEVEHRHLRFHRLLDEQTLVCERGETADATTFLQPPHIFGHLELESRFALHVDEFGVFFQFGVARLNGSCHLYSSGI